MRLHKGSRQSVSSLTWRRPTRQSGNMVLFETFTGLASEADCLFLSQNISGTAESESELGPHFLTNSTQRRVFQLVVSWLWPVLDWRSMNCHPALPGTFSEHYLLTTCQSVFVLDTIERHLQQAVNSIQVCSPQVHSHTFHCTLSQDSETPHCEDWKHTSASGGVNKVPWVVVGFTFLL